MKALEQHTAILQMLGVKNTQEDYTVIPVTLTLKDGTTQTIEDGMVTHCDHAGASYEGVDSEYIVYDPVYQNYMPQQRSEMAYVCECGETSPDGEDW